MSSESIMLFVSRLIKEKGFGNLDSEVLKQIESDLADRVEDRINASILEHMPPQKLEEFNELLEGADMEKIQSFCQENIISLNNIVAEEMLNFRNIYLNS